MNPAVQRLLSEVENPVVETCFVEAIHSGSLVRIEHTPDALVVPIMLLQAIAREWGERPVLDKINVAARRVRTWLDQQNPVFESHLLLNTIFNGLPIASDPQATYIVNAYKELTGVFSSSGRDYGKQKATRRKRKTALQTSKRLSKVA